MTDHTILIPSTTSLLSFQVCTSFSLHVGIPILNLVEPANGFVFGFQQLISCLVTYFWRGKMWYYKKKCYFSHQHGSSFSLSQELGTAHLKIWLWQKYMTDILNYYHPFRPNFAIVTQGDDNNLSRDKFVLDLCQFLLTCSNKSGYKNRETSKQ